MFYFVLVCSENYAEDVNQEGYEFTGPEVLLSRVVLETLNLRVVHQLPDSCVDSFILLHFAVRDLLEKTNLVPGGFVTP